nr:sigma-70 family RNA polymerase sigma factor [Lachnoclostridium sp. MSJ-17]
MWGGKVSSAKISYGTLSDDVLAQHAKDGDERAFNELVLRYLGRISSVARKYFARGYEHTDFVQEGLLGLFHAARTYRSDSESTFRNYAMLVVERRYISVIRRQSAQRSVPEDAIVDIESLDSELADTAKTPEEELMLSEQLRWVYSRLLETLSKQEYAVLELYVDGLSYSDIAERLGITPKAVDNALQRVRRKVSRFDMS